MLRQGWVFKDLLRHIVLVLGDWPNLHSQYQLILISITLWWLMASFLPIWKTKDINFKLQIMYHIYFKYFSIFHLPLLLFIYSTCFTNRNFSLCDKYNHLFLCDFFSISFMLRNSCLSQIRYLTVYFKICLLVYLFICYMILLCEGPAFYLFL